MLQFHAQSMSVKVVVEVGVKHPAARIPEPGYGKKAGGLLYNVTLSHDRSFLHFLCHRIELSLLGSQETTCIFSAA